MVIKVKDLRIIFYAAAIFSYSLLLTNIVTVFNNITGLLKAITLFFISCNFIINLKNGFKFNVYSFFKTIIVSVLIIFSFLFGLQELEIVLIILTMIACIDIDENDLLKTYAITIFILLGFVFLLWNINVIPNTVDSFKRYTLGFKYTTFSFNLFLSAVLAYFSSNKVKANFMKIFTMSILVVYLYYMTNTLSALVVSFIFLFFMLVTKKENIKGLNITGFVERIIINMPIIIAVVTLAFQLYYNANSNNPVMFQLNKMLSGRLYYGKKAFMDFNITLFGQKTLWNFEKNGNYFYVDSSYLNILFSYGIVTLSIVCFIFRRILKYAIKNHSYYLCFAIVVFLIHSVTDPQLLTLRYDPFLSLYFGIIFKNLKMKKGEKNE